MATETCGYPTESGPCQLPAGDDGSCHLDSHEPTSDDDGDNRDATDASADSDGAGPTPGRQRTRARSRTRGV